MRGAGLDRFRHDINGGALLTYPYVAISEGYHVLSEIDPAVGTASLTHDLLLESGRSLIVTVLGPGGQPLTGCMIRGRTDFGDWEEAPIADIVLHDFRASARQGAGGDIPEREVEADRCAQPPR